MINKFGHYYKRKRVKRSLRLAVYERDNFTCQYCGAHADEEELQIDHIVPVSRGGTNDFNNLITSCSTCNKKKGAKLKQDTQVPDAIVDDEENVLVYEVNGERFILPATKENQSWFRDFMMTAMSSRAVAPA